MFAISFKISMCYAVVIDWLRTVYAVSVSYGCLLFARMIFFLTAIFDFVCGDFSHGLVVVS